jgi:hypothetical protein
VDLEAEFKKMGIFDSLDPGAVSLHKSLALAAASTTCPWG